MKVGPAVTVWQVAPGDWTPERRWSGRSWPLQQRLIVVLFWLSEGWRDIDVGFWDPVLARVEDIEEDEEKEEEGRCGPLPAEQVASAQSHEVDLAGASRPNGGEEHLKETDV